MIFFDESGFGEVMTFVDVNLTILEDYKTFMHVDHDENILYDSYIIEFDYDPACNYYERGKYGCRNFHVTQLPLLKFKLLMPRSSSLHMLDTFVMTICLPIKCLCIGSMLDLNVFFTCFMMLSSCFNYYLS